MRTHICFHGIGECEREREPGEAHYWMSRAEFLRSLDVIAAVPGVEISFDDGNLSDVEQALPALLERGLKATFFALAGRLDDSRSLQPADLQHLRAEGMSIGNHGWDHIPWRRLSDAEATRELLAARAALAAASGGPVDDAALPLGRYDRRALQCVRRAGYRHLYTSDRHRSRDGAWLRARYSVTATDTADTVRVMLDRRLRPTEARNMLAGAVKRLR